MSNYISRKKRIIKILEEKLQPSRLFVDDQSHLHEGHAGIEKNSNETHFFIEIVSEKFREKNKIDRHRLVNQLLVEEFDTGLHALELKLKEV